MDPVFGVIAAAAVAALATWLVAVRQFSGKVATSDASDLWQESRSIREWSSEELGRLRERIAKLEADREECRTLLSDAHARIEELERTKGGRRTDDDQP